MTWRNLVVLGATSDIARAISSELARRGTGLVLAGRDVAELGRLAADLRVRYGIDAAAEPFDALACEDHPAFVRRCFEGPREIDGVVLCFGSLGPPPSPGDGGVPSRPILDANFTGAVSVLEAFAGELERRRRGIVVVLSSVAGDRGRQSNYLYGAAKGGLSVYCQGLRNRLFARGAHVLTVKPGFVATAMTRGVLDPDSPLVASPDRVARDVVRAMERRRDVIYTPWFWWWIMAIVRSIPEFLFKRMRL